ncbi:hypothetical protein OQA88_7891 [Cercophora sp. LCS_1]
MSQELQPYTYRPLGHKEIRVLHLDPHIPGADLFGTIDHVPLQDPTFINASPPTLHHENPYEAISYSWGDNTATPCKLVIRTKNGNRTLPIRKNLAVMLEQFALPTETRALWIDAICIDQSDNKERENQVWLMPDIYRIARRVLVYLGPECDNSEAALDFVEHVAKYSEYLDESLCIPGRSGMSLAKAKGFVMPPVEDAKTWKAWRAFWRRPWFRRVWIIQEFVYATEISVFCGPRELKWIMLKMAAKAFVDCKALIYPGFKPLEGTRRMEEFRQAHEGAIAFLSVVEMRLRTLGAGCVGYFLLSIGEPSAAERELVREGIWRHELRGRNDMAFWERYESLTRQGILSARAQGEVFPYGQQDLLQLLVTTRNFRATLPVDRMFGLLGLASDVERGKLADSPFAPSYSEDHTVDIVSTRYAAALMRSGKFQQVLSMAGIHDGTRRPPDQWPRRFVDWFQQRFGSSGETQTNDSKVDEELRRFPSWVPDWISVKNAQTIVLPFCFEAALGKKGEDDDGEEGRDRTDNNTTRGQSRNMEPPLYNAALNTTANLTIDEANKKLTVQGRMFDSIATVLPGRLLLSPLWYEAVATRVITPYATGESTDEVIWKTMIANRGSSLERAPSEYGEEYAYIKKCDAGNMAIGVVSVALAAVCAVLAAVFAARPLISWDIWLAGSLCCATASFGYSDWWLLSPLVLAIRDFPKLSVVAGLFLVLRSAKRNLNTALRAVFELGPVSIMARWTMNHPAECAGYLKSWSLTATKYNLCLTLDRRVALVPLSAREGDGIVIFHGCAAPFVVRENGRGPSFRLVGEAYVHGVMEGQVMTDRRYKDEEFVLY